MKSGVKYTWLVLIVVAALFGRQPCQAQDVALERVENYGTIDWVGQKVIAKGIGAPPEKYYGKPQARPLALRAAVTDARRNLLEVIKGVHIDSITRVNNYMVRDDTIVARVQGIMQNSSVDDTQYMSDGTVEVIVSMPLTGELGETLIKMAAQPPGVAPEAMPAQAVEDRIRLLEDRVKALEDKLAGLKEVTGQQQEMILFFKQFVTAWLDYTASRPLIIQAGYGSEDANLEKKLAEQESRLTALAVRFDEMAGRLAKLETAGIQPAPKTEAVKSQAEAIYSGVVIDARNTDFRPCLKPEIFANGELIYPGAYVDMQQAVRKGYVRYYRQIGQAQQSDRVGKLPYTINAKGTSKGKRSLEVGGESYSTLKPLMNVPDSFLAGCKVVIVF
ncbi:MAG: hypothetical protein ISS65_04900 [Desulfobacterales bacterium]|nr:hypothetical protein [Desulfobacterales bacterium]